MEKINQSEEEYIIEKFQTKFSLENFEKKFKDYLKTIEGHQQYISSLDYNEYYNNINTLSEPFEADLRNLLEDVEKLLKQKPKLEKLLEYLKNKEKLLLSQGMTKIDEGDFCYYIGKQSPEKKRQGSGIHNIQNNSLYYGEFDNDNFIKGLMIRKIDDNKMYNIYIGSFTKEKDVTIFNGIFYPNFDENPENEDRQLSIILGKITDNTQLEGLIVYSYSDKTVLPDIMWGGIKHYVKEGKCLIVNNNDDFGFVLGEYVKDNSKNIYIWSKQNFLINKITTNEFPEHISIFFVNKDTIYDGKIYSNWDDDENAYVYSIGTGKGRLMYSNNDIFEGDFTQEGFRNQGDYLIRDNSNKKSKFIISAKYLNDKIKNTGKIYKFSYNPSQTKHLLFEGTFNEKNEIVQGTYYYNEKEKFIGTFKNFLKHGRGEYLFEDGSKLIGEWVENKKHGSFSYVDLNGASHDKEYYMDKEILKQL